MTLTVSGEGRERLGRARELEVVGAGSSREGGGLASGGHGRGHDGGAVDEVVRVVAEDGELGHRGPERVHHKLLLVAEALPEARRARVAREREVALQPELARVVPGPLRQRRRDLARVVVRAGEARALEQHLEEDLGVEGEGRLEAVIRFDAQSREKAAYGVEGSGIDALVDLVRTSDGV